MYLGRDEFSHRVPEGKVLLRCFLGGTGDTGVLEESDEAITSSVLEELHRIVGFSARPSFARIFRWPRAMAQYGVGHQQRVAELYQRLGGIPGSISPAMPMRASASRIAFAPGNAQLSA